MQLGRMFFAAVALVSLASATSNVLGQAEQSLPATGEPVESLQSYDRLIPEFMKRWKLLGGSVAVSRNGKLVFARGYGWANLQTKQPVQPDSLFRLASVSKPITAATVLALAEQGRLNLS